MLWGIANFINSLLFYCDDEKQAADPRNFIEIKVMDTARSRENLTFRDAGAFALAIMKCISRCIPSVFL